MKHLFGKTFCVLAALALALSATVPVYAGDATTSLPLESETPSQVINAELPASDAGQSGSQPEPAAPISVQVTGYEVQNTNGTPKTDNISLDDVVLVKVSLVDKRENAPKDAAPNATLNTASFRSVGEVAVDGSSSGEFTLTFTARYTGSGATFGFNLNYQGSGVAMEYISFPLHQCVEPPEQEEPKEEPLDETETKIRGTGFVLKSLSFSEGRLYAGEPFTVSAVLMATNGEHTVDNVAISLTLPKALTITEGDSIAYIGTVRPNQEIPVTFAVQADATAEPGSHTLSVQVAGASNVDGESIDAEVDITVPIHQRDRFEVKNIKPPSPLNMALSDGEFGSLSLVNKGKTTVYNVTMEVKGEGIAMTEGSIFVGNMDSGTQKAVDFALTATKMGQQSGTLTVTYETAAGTEESQSFPLKIEVVNQSTTVLPGAEEILSGVEQNLNESLTGWVWLLLAAMAVGLVLCMWRIGRRKKAEQQLLLEEEPYDEAV